MSEIRRFAYTDDILTKANEVIEETKSRDVQKTTENQVAYGTDSEGNQYSIPYAKEPIPNDLAMRDSNGELSVETLGSSDKASANVAYVNEKVMRETAKTIGFERDEASKITTFSDEVVFEGNVSFKHVAEVHQYAEKIADENGNVVSTKTDSPIYISDGEVKENSEIKYPSGSGTLALESEITTVASDDVDIDY